MNFRIRPKQWYRTRGGEIVYCVGRLPKQLKDITSFCWRFVDDGAYNLAYTTNGRFADKEDHRDIIEHLPDCTGFDWVPQPEPQLQLREGAWYERKDGLIVGPCEPYIDPYNPEKRKWVMCGRWYHDDGHNPHSGHCIVREVEPPKPPQPKYRPFRSMEEFTPFRERWWRCKNHKTVLPPCHYNDTRHGGSTWVDRFARYVFEDGSPFGIIDNE
jgi:hypothetical protein